MDLSSIAFADPFARDRSTPTVAQEITQSQTSAVSWGAVLAGAAAAAALSMILLMLGVGLGLSAISPWAYDGVSATTLGWSSIIWITFTQLAASGMGGYLAGRLRTKWVAIPTDEAYFRDTAHGFLAWAIASLATAALLTSAVGSIVGRGADIGASIARGVAATATTVTAAGVTAAGGEVARADGGRGPMDYFVDSLFRSNPNIPSITPSSTESNANVASPPPTPATSAGTGEISRIFMNSIFAGPLPAGDLRYLGQVVAQRTGLSQADAERRVTDVYTRAQGKLRDAETAAKDAADSARKASAYAALWLFISLLIGAFGASLAATYGGRQRDL